MTIDTPFIYSRTVAKDDFIGRSNDIVVVKESILQGNCIALFGIPKCGKSSLLKESLRQLEAEGKKCLAIHADLCSVRSKSDLIEILSATFSAHFKGDMQADDLESLLLAPYLISTEREDNIVVILDNFHSILQIENFEKVLSVFENTIRDNTSRLDGAKCAWIFTGSAINAMKDIFERNKYFFRIAKVLIPETIPPKIVFKHITHNLLYGGKVIEEDQMQRIYTLFRGEIYYINHIMAICDHLSNGLVTVPVVTDALNSLLSIHVPKFRQISDDLTGFQANFIKAILAEKHSFSSQEVIKEYGLNSSANVKRVKEALTKKEIIDFDADGKPYVIDPLYEYWLRYYFFARKSEL